MKTNQHQLLILCIVITSIGTACSAFSRRHLSWLMQDCGGVEGLTGKDFILGIVLE